MNTIYHVKTSPVALKDNIIQGEKYRITMLTECLVRLEYSENGVFEDRPTQMVFHRDFPKTEFTVIKTNDGIQISTTYLQIKYNEKDFSPSGLSIQFRGNLTAYHSIWHYGDKITDLGGTARTLDEADGEIPLENGIISKNGFSVLDDSKSQAILEDGWIEPRQKGIKDIYFWGYGHNYKQAISDFYKLCGKTPMLPRYALGNWWSRYYKYTEKSYLELMDKFKENNIPFSVAVIDMDWHLVDIDPKYGSGWTGYTWNKDFFPNPKRFLDKLHEYGMKTTLNVHPADGVQPHEEMYKQIAEHMGVDYENEQPVMCDPADPKFMEAYFKYLHHPREQEGVDFWWIDWQQGNHCKIEGLDPLWIFNHYHFLDSAKNGKRPITFSRYAGAGSHRYPVGFSGDTITTWESLDFQPYFTLTASNIGYGWWSHDIGGHMMGYKNDEMVTRWIQFGIYSPIMRLHSSCSEFNGKEPWRYKKECEIVMSDMLRERHKMIPYLYTMNHKNYQDNIPLIIPMYYEHPENNEAYNFKNQYYFGSELLVAPITSPRIKDLNVSKVSVWLPKGTWYDIYTGMVYNGDRTLDMYRDLSSIPVFAHAGAIIPMTDDINNVENNPENLTIKVFAGANGQFTLYEDDNTSCDYQNNICATTKITYEENENAVLTIYAPEGNTDLIPSKRNYKIELTGFVNTDDINVNHNFTKSYDEIKNTICIYIDNIKTDEQIEITINTKYKTNDNHILKRCFDFLNQAEIGFILKDELFNIISNETRMSVLLSKLSSINMDKHIYNALVEILTA